ncbi:transmembrane emp24 domain-containing protein a [Anaeramoeba flamelloides]|uniref:Transmembrane emp24 domain-containing protein a n=1 Tax=Anaeramoeba flamelloides TaxID=1746091 RepID=A0ABQ8XNV3_9EUKA|nr:transmembrane emp24 domain-containing protein a [Anaeramoeba flamelloides]
MKLLVFSFILLSFFVSNINSITITVPANGKECVFEKIDKRTSVTLLYQVVSGGGMDINPEISEPDGRVVYRRDREQEGKFTFLSRSEGMFKFCFGNEMSHITSKQVNFNIQLSGGQSNSEIAKKEHLTPLENGVLELQEQLRSILSEQRYLKVREHIHRNTTESTNSRVLWWNFLQTFLLIAISATQIFYVRRIFERRRRI